MKRFLLITAIYLAAATGLSLRAEKLSLAKPQPFRDTITIKLSNGAGMKIFVKSTSELKSLQNYKFDSLLAMLSNYIEKAEAMEKTDKDQKSKELTMTFYPAKDSKDPQAPEQVTVTISASGISKSDEKEKTIENMVNIIVDYNKNRNNNDDDHDDGDHDDEDNKAEKQAKKRNRKTNFISKVDLGYNAFAKYPNGSGDLYDLKPLGSRYISLNQHLEARIGGPASPFHLVSGFELAFNNYMFDKNRYLTDNNGTTEFAKEEIRSFEKSKLATSSINVPLMAKLKFRDKSGKNTFLIGAGGFAGYRLGSHSKLKYQAEGRTIKDKERSSYNLEDFQYGVNFSIGYRKFELFGKYNLNELFKDGRGPSINVVSFGVRI